MARKVLVLLCVLIVGVAVFIGTRKHETMLDYYPLASTEQWWGSGNKPDKEDVSIREFEIPYDKEMVEDLKHRLSSTRYFEPINEEDKWERGTPPQYTKEIVEYWKNEYNWEKQVAYLNSYPQFVTSINGLDIHFVHVKAKNTNKDTRILPILLLHGWPGSFFEFYGSIPYLTVPNANNFAFDVVVPSLPGYGFSQATRKKGLNGAAITAFFPILMKRLGYDSYISQGGDYGSFFARLLPIYDPEHCIGAHLNMITAPTPWYGPFQLALASLLGPNTIFTEQDHKRMLPVLDFLASMLRDSGYMHIQATRPNSLGQALTDSPAGLAAYISEKFYFWSDSQGDIYTMFTKDQILTNIMIYWANNAITSSINYYYEIVGDLKFMHLLTQEEIKAPVALADFKAEIRMANRAVWAHIPFKNIIQYTFFAKGGHFGAMEQPEAFSKDVLAFGEKLLNISSLND